LLNPAAATYASSINTADLDTLIPYHSELGQQFFKIKVGFLDKKDRVLVERACDRLPDGARFMIDSNQSWDLAIAKSALQSLEPLVPYFAEEPLPANSPLTDWETLASATSIPLAGGENIYGIDQFLSMADAGLKVLQPDVAKWGGVTGALDLAQALPGGTVLWPHFMGTAVGQMAALSVTAAVAFITIGDAVCEVDVNSNKLRTELCGKVMHIRNGHISLTHTNGIVVEPTAEMLRNFADT